VAIAEYLHLDVARALDVFLYEDMRIAERRGRLALAGGEGIGKIRCRIDLAHPLAAAAGDCLDQHGIADFGRAFGKEGRVLVLAQIARGDGHAGFGHQFLGGVFQAHRRDAGRLRPDPDQPGIDHGLREFRVFGKEAITRMDRLRTRGLGGGNDLLTDQIGFARRRRPDMHRLVRLTHMQRLGIGIRIDCDGANAHRARSADDPTGDLAAIGDEEGGDHVSRRSQSCARRR